MCLEQVMNVGGTVVRARVATTTFDHRVEVPLESSIRNVETPIGGVNGSVTGNARWIHAVKRIGARLNTSEEIVRFGYTQQVTRTILVEFFADPRHNRAEVFLL